MKLYINVFQVDNREDFTQYIYNGDNINNIKIN